VAGKKSFFNFIFKTRLKRTIHFDTPFTSGKAFSKAQEKVSEKKGNTENFK
jgi:hypothetical protein